MPDWQTGNRKGIGTKTRGSEEKEAQEEALSDSLMIREKDLAQPLP